MARSDVRLPAPSRHVPFLDVAAMHADVAHDVERAWREVFACRSFVGGTFVEAFERSFAEYCGVGAAVGTGNGTDSLTLILRALGIGRGDEVVVPTNTFVATAEAVLHAGARPRFADVDDRTLLLTPDSLTAALTPRTAAVVPVHLYGQLPDMPGIAAVAARHGLAVIEDAAQAHGALLGGQKAGSFGVAAAFSFYPGKNLGAYGDAGAVVTDDTELARRIRSLSNHGRLDGSNDTHGFVGTNSRLDALQACVLSAKLAHLDRGNAMRRSHLARVRSNLHGLAVTFPSVLPGVTGAHHLNVVRVRHRDAVRDELSRRAVPTGVHYRRPCHQIPCYRTGEIVLPVAERAAAELLTLPLSPHMTDDEVDFVSEALDAALDAAGAAGD